MKREEYEKIMDYCFSRETKNRDQTLNSLYFNLGIVDGVNDFLAEIGLKEPLTKDNRHKVGTDELKAVLWECEVDEETEKRGCEY